MNENMKRQIILSEREKKAIIFNWDIFIFSIVLSDIAWILKLLSMHVLFVGAAAQCTFVFNSAVRY